MIRWRRAVVTGVDREWRGSLEVHVTAADGEMFRALAYPGLVGRPEVGDEVLLSAAALELGLGTGGYALIVAIPARLPEDVPLQGHMVKARYTPLQTVVDGAEERYPELATASSLDGMPVVVADLHSALPAVLAGILADRPSARVAYVMTDGGALPLWFSRTVDGLRSAGWLAAGTVTVGQAFGGDLECVTVHSGLLAARHVLGADIAIVTQGPGNLGTGTEWGFSGVACGEAVNATAVLGGLPVAALRVSSADERERHRGVSHHSLTAYGKVALARAEVALPDVDDAFWREAAAQAAELEPRHAVVRVPVDGLDAALRSSPVKLSTMGRGLDQDHAAFLASACAGRLAATRKF
ncbi:DUF3866 family protein [Catenulispora sp. NL8]|uniref:DUF3866 family protein n=1 Tax=Catenulispora pinistramenti TaxID=2705254 RepID=A0ABS5L8S4_9ACTN|nr:DUF3866 family protein [Catenulispora pinistramenti]